MKEIYSVEGAVNRGFVGQITYMVCLEEVYDKLDIHFSFDADKRTYSPEDITEQLMNDTRALATKRMVQEAEALGADAIVGMAYASSAVMQGAAEVIAYGTAVKYRV
jgi:hypothetical protein